MSWSEIAANGLEKARKAFASTASYSTMSDRRMLFEPSASFSNDSCQCSINNTSDNEVVKLVELRGMSLMDDIPETSLRSSLEYLVCYSACKFERRLTLIEAASDFFQRGCAGTLQRLHDGEEGRGEGFHA
jgi:hypothetical protein